MASGAHYRRNLVARSRELRITMTPAERILWECVRARRCGGFKFYRQRVVLDYIADFYNSEAMLVIEVDGDSHDADRQRFDRERDGDLSAHGYNVLRFTNAQIFEDPHQVCAQILSVIYHILDNDAPSRTREGAART